MKSQVPARLGGTLHQIPRLNCLTLVPNRAPPPSTSSGDQRTGSMMMVAEVSRTRVFTATWPAYAPATDLAVAAQAEMDSGKYQPGPFCQLEIRRAVLTGTLANAFSSDDTATDSGDGLVFLERRLLLRSYNSVSLSDGGAYRLTLADCHGFVPVPSSSPGHNALPVPPYAGGPEKAGGRAGYRGPAESIRLIFHPLPHSIEFSVESEQDARGKPVIGNFQLLPVAHVPQLQHLPIRAMLPNPDTVTINHADYGCQNPKPPQASLGTGVSQTAQVPDGIDQARKSDHGGGDGADRTPPTQRSSTGCFVSGAVVGVLLGIMSAWIAVVKGLGKEAWKRLRNWFVRAHGAKEGWGRAMVGARREQKTAGIHAISRNEEPSENGSSDSDGILDGNVPEPVGLPRSEEAWRALFDTLYEDHVAVGAAEARAERRVHPE